MIKDAVCALVIVPDTDRANDAVNAYDAVVEVVAFPVNEPDIPFVTIKLPVIVVAPVIDTLLPDIFVSRYVKLPSPSANVNTVFFTVSELPALGVVVERNIKPIILSFIYKYTKRMAPQVRDHRSWWEGVWFIVEFVVYHLAIDQRRALQLHIRGNIFVLL